MSRSTFWCLGLLGSTWILLICMLYGLNPQINSIFLLLTYITSFWSYVHFMSLDFEITCFTVLALINVKRLDAWGTSALNIAILLPGGFPLMVHGIYRNHFIWDGNNGTALVTVVTTACLPERKNGRKLVLSLSSIMENGLFSVPTESRFFRLLSWHFSLLSTLVLGCIVVSILN